jgi:membrane-associated phospholipid phosphatase
MLRAVFERLQELDRRLLRTMRTRYHAPQIEDAVKALGMAGEWGAVWVAIGVAAAAVDATRRERWLRAAAVAPAAVGVNYLVKLAVRRRRPRLRRLPPLAAAPSELSFPSAHATSSLAAAVAMGRVAPGSRPPLYGLAGAICLTRPYLGMHYPSDVLGGAAIGLAIGRLWPGLRGKGAEDRLIDLVASAAPSTPAPSPHRSSANGDAQVPASRPWRGHPLSEGDPGRS